MNAHTNQTFFSHHCSSFLFNTLFIRYILPPRLIQCSLDLIPRLSFCPRLSGTGKLPVFFVWQGIYGRSRVELFTMFLQHHTDVPSILSDLFGLIGERHANWPPFAGVSVGLVWWNIVTVHIVRGCVLAQCIWLQSGLSEKGGFATKLDIEWKWLFVVGKLFSCPGPDHWRGSIGLNLKLIAVCGRGVSRKRDCN